MAKENPWRFSTKFTDDETELLYYGYRFYSPSLGRWLSRDPIGINGGVNLYGYIGNDPVDYVDVNGRDSYPPQGITVGKPDSSGGKDGEKGRDSGKGARISPEDKAKLEFLLRLAKLLKDIKNPKPGINPCLCLDSVTAFYCNCMKNNITDIRSMASCICAASTDNDCEKKWRDDIQKALDMLEEKSDDKQKDK